MCGIAGIVDLSGKGFSPALLWQMNQRLSHRGPDDEGYVILAENDELQFVEMIGDRTPADIQARLPVIRDCELSFTPQVGLAHSRYSIIDLSSSGHQPFFDQDRRTCLVFNGEIYNYLEVRDELKKLGHQFCTESDTEVIAEAYKAWGANCFQHLNGMWALALYDFNCKTLILSRDRLGKKPLYWTRVGQTIYFASEIKALLRCPDVLRRKAVNEAAIYPFLVHGLRDVNASTFFQEIYSLPAAVWATITPDFPDTCETYWQPPTQRVKETQLSIGDAIERVQTTLDNAVQIRMRADVPWGVELSGGMDSSVMVALASQNGQRRLNTYTVSYPEKEWNEEPFARAVAQRFGTNYRVIESPLANFWHDVQAFTDLEEEPYHAPNLHTNQIVRTLMRADGIKMLISGSAGDELFAGYSSYYQAFQIENLLQGRLKTYLRNARHWTEGKSAVRSALHPFSTTGRKVWGTVQETLKRGKPKAFQYLTTDSIPYFDGFTLSKRIYNDVVHDKIPYWLRSGDKTHMGIPIEARAPFLDYRVVELALELPVTYLIRDGWHKWILRKTFEETLPAEVVWRKQKMGFPFPYNRFFADSENILRLILQECQNPYVDINQIPSTHEWRLISFLLWYELFFNNNVGLFDKIQRLSKYQPQNYRFIPNYLESYLWKRT